jgi:glycine/D-amino acid oxidase-like deaminating enzyme
MHVLVCGAGVIGAATAYALARRGIRVTLVERWRTGGAASGKSGGFLARDWCDGTPVEGLAQLSFDLHETWAEELGNPYGYRRVDTFSAAMSVRRKLGGQAAPEMAGWLAPGAVHRQQLGTPATTAQLDPFAFTNALAYAAVARGAELTNGTISGLSLSGSGERVRGVQLDDGTVIACDAVVLAMGPWSLLAAAWLPLPPVYGLKGHSIVLRPHRALPAEAIFAQFEDRDGEIITPEIVPRADGTLYVCGLSGEAPMPVDPARVLPEPGGCEKLFQVTTELVPELADSEIVAQQACYRPVTADGMPLIGGIDGIEGAFVATGHSVWGMLNAPGTAELLADLITRGSTAGDLAPFAPSRLAPLDPADLELRAD